MPIGHRDANQIRSMFGEIAGSYDLANTVLSGGIHHLWRRRVVKFSEARSGQRVLDCATGTGDLAIEFKRAVGPLGDVVGTDFCAEMLQHAPEKARKAKLDITFTQADVTKLPYDSGVFNISSISFGIRNVADPVKGLSELARVVRPGGVVMILEFGQPSWWIFRVAYEAYSRYVLPKIGGWITGRKAAYEYLQNSSAKFPCGDEFIAMMKSTGRFTICEARPLTFGVAYMYKGIVKKDQ
jgi:demethylmenaquinone methyltransferase/2-methoxy-6-polyprenyl-1,4-benzoquinol methylase